MFFTTALPYINGTLHIGHIFEIFYSEYYSILVNNFKKKKIITGLDCHGLIKKQNINKIYKLNLLKIKYFNLNINFSKTITLINKRICNWVYLFLLDNDYFYAKLNKKLFNKKKNFFIPDKYVIFICKNCKSEMQKQCISCKNYNFLLKIKISKKNLIFKKSFNIYFKNYKFVDWDLSRNLTYNGFLVLSKKKIFYYVWYDALISYISNSLKSEKKIFKKEFNQIIGKDIIYFHNIFKIILKLIKFKNNKIIVHSFILINNDKISKSKKNYLEKKINIFNYKFYILLKLKNENNDINFNYKLINLTFKKIFFKKIINLYFRIRTLIYKFDHKTSEFFYYKKKHNIILIFNKLNNLYKLIKKKILDCGFLNKIINKNLFWKNKNVFLMQFKYTFFIKQIISIINFFYFIINKQVIKKKIEYNSVLFNLNKFYDN